MTPERFERVRELFDRAMALPVDERRAFIAEACPQDAEVRAEVERLVDEDSGALFVGVRRLVGEAADTNDRAAPEREVGSSISHYTILGELSRGGMGIVYRALDPRLNREVAIKVLPPGLVSDPERKRRFITEAKSTAALKHPNIAVIYEVDDAEGEIFIAMELIEGEVLKDVMAREPMSVERALDIAADVGRGLAKAHEKKILHRDIKPSNIMITEEGQIKIIDFGLAKFLRGGGSDAKARTATRDMTEEGKVFGTTAFMSPEQARGEALDGQTDIWSLGVVLYEMLAGHAPFEGSHEAAVMHAILYEEPEPVDDVDSAVARIVRRALAKSKDERYGTVDEMLADLARVREPRSSPEAVTRERVDRGRGPVLPRSPLLRASPWIAVSASLLAIWALVRAVTPEALVSRTSIVFPADQTFQRSTTAPSVAISPDGRHVAYIARVGDTSHLFLRPIDEIDGRLVSGSEGANAPFFSPDSLWLGFEAGTRLLKVAVRAGTPVLITETGSFNIRGASWGEDGWIVFNATAGGGLMRVPAEGGEPETLSVPDRRRLEKSHRLPEVLPGGKGVLFTLGMGDQTSWDDAAIAVYSMETGEHRVLVERGMDASYSPTGHVIYARDGSLFALPFELSLLEAQGTPVPVVDGVTTSLLHGQADYAISRSGSLVYASGASWAENGRIMLVSREGRAETLLSQPRAYREVRISPDGKSLALTIEGGATSSIWLFDLSRSTLTRVAHQFDHYSPAWSPEGDQLAFTSNRMGSAFNLFSTTLDDPVAQPRLTESDHRQYPGSWLRDGTIVFDDFLTTSGSGWDIWRLSLGSEPTSEPLLRTEFNESDPTISPDGLWMAYVSDESEREEVYIRGYRDSRGRLQVSTEGGTEPRWSANGRELFYRNGNRVIAVSFDANEPSPLGVPKELFERSAGLLDYDVTPEGRHFVTLEAIETEPPDQLILVQNWFQELERLVPTEN